MKHVTKKSVLPIYFVGIVWILLGAAGSLHLFKHYIYAILASFIVFLLGKIVFPDRGWDEEEQAQEAEEAQPPKARAEKKPDYPPEIAALVEEREKALSEMGRLNDSIEDPLISDLIDRMEATTGKIIDAVVDQPEKLPQIRRFMNYYLPTTLKLLNAYDRMDAAGVSGTNIDGTKGKIEDMLATVCTAFDKQLDSLFGAEALDISTDITVMEQMLAREGLGGHQLGG